ncbi:TetR/AcrR family transcriptional regulator [Novosphingobium sp. G106]|uniref:TetR/AcrR family transcriptional regulator n=1 Tax=Novosphingobium sp. G106 TaxID=2849500 RepID=UPI001C2DC12A|nr:TetR/AcrR family transcriptional regulator [Novosphingobium sp. G106]MBV1688880.1 TetR/AcrR family transcriptional regulator [Novosphingobium sp. G106]
MPSKSAAAPDSPFRSREGRLDDRARKREAVLRAAVRMFNERGFHSASLDEVAASLGISKPTIYHYLGNKEQVLIECVTRGLEQLSTAAEQSRKAPGTGLDRLMTFLRRYAQVNMDDFGRCVIRTGDESLSPVGAEQFRARKREIDRSLRKLIEDAVADGSAADCDVRLTAFALAGALNGPARWYDPDGPMSPEEVARRLVEQLVTGIAPRPAA